MLSVIKNTRSYYHIIIYSFSSGYFTGRKQPERCYVLYTDDVFWKAFDFKFIDGKGYNKEDFDLDSYKGLSKLISSNDELDDTLSKIPEKVKEDHEKESFFVEQFGKFKEWVFHIKD